MRTTTKRVLPVAAAALAIAPWFAAAPASAASTTTLTGTLSALNGSGARSTATLKLDGNQAHITIHSSGLLAGSPHAQHFHIGGTMQCPDPGTKGTGTKNHITTSDGQPDYGMIKYSLTTKGDYSAKSGLAVDRFPVGDATYDRTITLSASDASAIRNGSEKVVIVQHGVDYNGDKKYSGSAKSDLDPSLPEEATDPATCGVLAVSQMSSMPGGGVQTGGGSTSGTEDAGLIGLGAAMLLGGAGVVALRRRQTVSARS